MGKKPENLFVDDRIGALRAGSHLPDALKARILAVGNDLEVPGFVRAVLVALVHRCDQAPTRVRVADVQAWLGVHRQIWMSDRTIKSAVSLLVTKYGVQVGSCRLSASAQHGYYFITTPAEAEAAIKPLAAEAKSLLRRISLLSPCRSYFRRMVGQMEVR